MKPVLLVLPSLATPTAKHCPEFSVYHILMQDTLHHISVIHKQYIALFQWF